jgi:hypothetical protein
MLFAIVNMKTIQIPVDINDLRDYSELHKLIKVCKQFINNSNEYIHKLVFTEYIRTYESWSAILSQKDLATVDNLLQTHPYYSNTLFEKNDVQIFRNIVDNSFGFFKLKNTVSTTGALSHCGYDFSFNNDGTIIKMHVKYKLKHYRRDNVPWIQHTDIWTLNLITKEFKFAEHL